MARVIVNGQYKGGVGKTTNTVLEAIAAASLFNKKVLLIDTDMQANATANLARTYGIESFEKSLMQALIDEDLESAITKLDKNLSIIPSAYDMRNYEGFLTEKFDNTFDKTFYFKKMLEPLQDKYDYIFVDVPPSTDLKVDTVMVATDYIIVVQQSQQYSYDGTETYINNYIATLVNDFGQDTNVEIIGILPALFNKNRELHRQIIQRTRSKFGFENVFRTTIENRARIERFESDGVKYEDYWDKAIFAVYADVFRELEARIDYLQETGDIDGFKYRKVFTKELKPTKRYYDFAKNIEFKVDLTKENENA